MSPSHPQIHPRDRQSSVAQSSYNGTESTSDQSDLSEGAQSSDNYGTTRHLRKRQNRYPTRRKRIGKGHHSGNTEDEDAYDMSESEEDVVRRSGRTGTRKNYKMDVDYEFRDESEDDAIEIDSDASFEGKGKRSTKPRKRRAPKPAYGRIRDMDDLDDFESPLVKHRDECEKCNRPAASLLLQKLKSQSGRKKKKKDDDFSENDDDFFNNLGGWVRWSVWFLHCRHVRSQYLSNLA